MRQILRLVHEQQGAPADPMVIGQEGLEPGQDGGLVQPIGRHAEGQEDQAQEVLGFQLRGHHFGHHQALFLVLGQYMVDEGGLARADLPRDDNETLTLGKAVLEIGDGLPMLPALEEKPVIGIELERQPTKFVII